MEWATTLADDNARPEDDDRKTPLTIQRHQDLLREGLGLSVIIAPADMRIEWGILGDYPGFGSGIIRVDRSSVDQSVNLCSQARFCDATSGFNVVLGIFFPSRDMGTG